LRLVKIGYVNSPVKEPVDHGWGRVISGIILEKCYRTGLKGLNSFSHLVIVFYMHQADFDVEKDIVRRPRGLPDLPETGIFAQRARHRPNPIGITAVENMGIEDGILKVKGLDAIDGTPILDIKPYVPEFDKIDDFSNPDWVGKIMEGYF